MTKTNNYKNKPKITTIKPKTITIKPNLQHAEPDILRIVFRLLVLSRVISLPRWLMQTQDIRHKEKNFKAAQLHAKLHRAIRSTPDRVNMHILKTLQPRSLPGRHFAEELTHIQDNIFMQKTVHAKNLEENKNARGQYLAAQRAERLKERRLAQFAHQLYVCLCLFI